VIHTDGSRLETAMRVAADREGRHRLWLLRTPNGQSHQCDTRVRKGWAFAIDP